MQGKTNGNQKDLLATLPYPRNRFFTGREDFIKNLQSKIGRNKFSRDKQPIAISGLTGIGKTQIAVEYAYRFHKSYQFLFWARGTSQETFFSDLVTIAHQLDLSEKNAKEQEVAVSVVKQWFQSHTRWLLICDDVSSPEVVKDFLHFTKQGQVLITTKNSSSIQEIAETLELEKMELDEGALFLLRRSNILALHAPLDVSSQNSLLAKDISFQLDGFPLALDHAGAYIGRTGCGLQGYMELYQALPLRPHLMRYAPHKNSLSVAATLMLSFETVREEQPIAAELLQLCAFFHPDAIPEELIIGGASDLGRRLNSLATHKIRWNECIEELIRYSLVRRNADEKTLTMHGLVQIILKDEMKPGERRRWAQRVVQTVSLAFPEVEHASWTMCQRYLPHALACAALITEWKMNSSEAAQLLHRTGQYLSERAQYIQAQPLLQGAQAIYEATVGSEHSDVAAVLDSLGYLFMQQGGDTAFNKAELLYLRALTTRKKVLGLEDPKTAQSLNHLGLLYYNQGKFSEAQPLYEKAKEIQEKLPELHHDDLAITLNNLAWLYYNLGWYEQAEPLLKQALAIQKRPEGTEPPAMASTLNALAMLRRSQGRYVEAESLFQKALKIRERTLGQKHPDVATTLNDLAWLYRTQGKYGQAHDYYKRVLAIRETFLGPRHLHVATTRNDQAILEMDQGEYTQSEAHFKEVLRVRERNLGPDHPNVGATLYFMGWLSYHQGEYAQARSLHERALEIYKKAVSGQEHFLHIARSQNALAEVYRAQGRYSEAEQNCEQALRIREQALASTHRNVITSLCNLANIFVEQGKYAQAEPLYERALTLRSKTPEAEVPRMIAVLNNVATFYVEQGEYIQAEVFYEEALRLYEKVLDPEHPDTLSVLHNLGVLYTLQGRYDKAESYLQRVVDGRITRLGMNHPLLGQSYDAQAQLFCAQGRFKEAEPLYGDALRIREKALGSDHPHAAQTRNNLGMLYAAQKKYDMAEPFLQRALAIRKEFLGSNHPHVAQTLNNLAEISRLQNDFVQAEQLCKEALEIDEHVLGRNHPHVAAVLNNLAEIYRAQNDFVQAEQLYKEALEIDEHVLGRNHPQVVLVLMNYAALQRALGQKTLAGQLEERATTIQKNYLLKRSISIKDLSPAKRPIEIFYVYDAADEGLRAGLEKQLTVLQQLGHITSWHSGKLRAGVERELEIEKHWNTAQIILLLVSANLFASDEKFSVIKRAIERHEAKTAHVIPILLRPVVDLKKTLLGNLTVLPANEKPVVYWRSRDKAFFDIATGIRNVVEELKALE